MDLKKATTLASVTVMTFMLAGGFFVEVRIYMKQQQPNHGISLSLKEHALMTFMLVFLIFYAESTGFCVLDPLHVFQLSHLQASVKGSVSPLHTQHQRDDYG